MHLKKCYPCEDKKSFRSPVQVIIYNINITCEKSSTDEKQQLTWSCGGSWLAKGRALMWKCKHWVHSCFKGRTRCVLGQRNTFMSQINKHWLSNKLLRMKKRNLSNTVIWGTDEERTSSSKTPAVLETKEAKRITYCAAQTETVTHSYGTWKVRTWFTSITLFEHWQVKEDRMIPFSCLCMISWASAQQPTGGSALTFTTWSTSWEHSHTNIKLVSKQARKRLPIQKVVSTGIMISNLYKFCVLIFNFLHKVEGSSMSSYWLVKAAEISNYSRFWGRI